MADIAAERAWMHRHAEQQAREGGAKRQQSDMIRRAEVARTCWFCFHDAHVLEYGGGLSGLVVQWCRDPVCLCGVPPCPGCGDRVRPSPTTLWAATCPMCGYETEVAVYG